MNGDSIVDEQEAELKGVSVGKTQSRIPPPENAESIRVRRLVIISFWAVVICMGLPLWLWTTSIHRESLPLQEMLDWADGKICRPIFPLQIAIDAPLLQEAEAAHLVRLTQHALDDLNEFSAHHLRLRLVKPRAIPSQKNILSSDLERLNSDESTSQLGHPGRLDDPALTVRLRTQDGILTARAELQSHTTVLDVFHASNQVPSLSSSSSALANVIAIQLQDLFAEEQATIAYVLSQSATSVQSTVVSPHVSSPQLSGSRDKRTNPNRSLNRELTSKVENRMTRSLKYAPTYHITLSLFTPSGSPSSWDIESALSEYFTPLLNSISAVSNFTIDTQIQLYAGFSPSVHPPVFDPDHGIWTLREEELSGFINAAEWPLSPSVGAGPTLNFVLYVPDPETSPLVVKGSQASGWLIPQWGGVFILNSQDINATSYHLKLSKETIQPALLTFSYQMLSFLGAPQTPSSLPLQLQTLTRIRAASLLLSASSTMGSLARLTVALPSIAIPETVSSAVDTTLMHLRSTCDALKDGRFIEALNYARIAEAQAEKGFFEKSMVGQVYFPDEHKVAVYLPLLGPVGVPLIMTALRELRRIWATRKVSAGKRSP